MNDTPTLGVEGACGHDPPSVTWCRMATTARPPREGVER
jgi:hypothetical protein